MDGVDKLTVAWKQATHRVSLPSGSKMVNEIKNKYEILASWRLLLAEPAFDNFFTTRARQQDAKLCPKIKPTRKTLVLSAKYVYCV